MKLVIRGDSYFVDGVEVTEDEFWRAAPEPVESGVPRAISCNAWPILSDAMGVHPEQIAEHEEVCRKKGVQTDCLEDGRVIFRDRDHRRRYMKAFGVHDRNGGYGDG